MPLDNAHDRPSTPRFEYTLWEPNGLLIRRLIDGTRAMHAAYKDYIAKYAAEKPPGYLRRATAAKLYGGLSRTLSASVGMLFAKPPELIDRWTPETTAHWENVDGKNTHGDVFCKRRAEDAIADGLVGILVDFPSPPAGVVVTAANEVELNLRPMWSAYARADILSWRTDVIDNVEQLTQVVLREGAAANVGRFGTKLQIRYRVCSLIFAAPDIPGDAPVLAATWELLEEEKSQSGQVTDIKLIARGVFRDKAGAPFREIPLALVYAGRTDSILTAHPPLLDVAWANLEHWQVATNLRCYEDLCCFPQPTVEGNLAAQGVTADGQPIPGTFQTGPGVLVHTTEGSKFAWVELQGTSLDQLRQSLQERKQEIADLGMAFLAKQTRGVETAESKRLDATAENSTLATAAQGIEDGINQALVFHAQYLGIEAGSAPTITINRDFEQLKLDPQVMSVYIQALQAGLPVRYFLDAWLTGGRLPPDLDVDAVELEMLANAGAEAERQRQEEQDIMSINSRPRKRGPVSIDYNSSGRPSRMGAVSIEYGSNGRPSRLVPSDN